MKLTLKILGTTALMSAIYIISFVIIYNVVEEINSDFLQPRGGMEMTWLLSFYWFIPIALLLNILIHLTTNERVKHLIPFLFCLLFFTLMNGGISHLHNRMILVALTFLTAVYSVIIGRRIFSNSR